MKLTHILLGLVGLCAVLTVYQLTLPLGDPGVTKYFTRQYWAQRSSIGELRDAARNLEGCRFIVQDIEAEQQISGFMDKEDLAQFREAVKAMKPGIVIGRSLPPQPRYHVHLHCTNGITFMENAPQLKDPHGKLFHFAQQMLKKYPTQPYELSETEKHNKQWRLEREEAKKKALEERQRFYDQGATNATP